MEAISTSTIFEFPSVSSVKEKRILGKHSNNQRFIRLLSDALENAGYTTNHAKGDADLLIVQTAIDSAKKVDTTLYSCWRRHRPAGPSLSSSPIPTRRISSSSLSQNRQPRVWDIKKTKNTLGPTTCNCLLFVHAVLGCDRVFGIGQPAALKKMKTDDHFAEVAKFMSSGSNLSKDEIIVAGEQALVCLYNGKPGENLDTLRYKRFRDKFAKSSEYAEAQCLLPTSAAAKYHTTNRMFEGQPWKFAAY